MKLHKRRTITHVLTPEDRKESADWPDVWPGDRVLYPDGKCEVLCSDGSYVPCSAKECTDTAE